MHQLIRPRDRKRSVRANRACLDFDAHSLETEQLFEVRIQRDTIPFSNLRKALATRLMGEDDEFVSEHLISGEFVGLLDAER
jgi:hypothetical protein